MNEPEIKSCPLCGCAKINLRREHITQDPVHIWCDECPIEMWGPSEQEVVRVWNTRAAEPGRDVANAVNYLEILAGIYDSRSSQEAAQSVRDTINALTDSSPPSPASHREREMELVRRLAVIHCDIKVLRPEWVATQSEFFQAVVANIKKNSTPDAARKES